MQIHCSQYSTTKQSTVRFIAPSLPFQVDQAVDAHAWRAPAPLLLKYGVTYCWCDGHPNELEKLTILGICIAADGPDLVIMHEQLTDFPYKLVPEAMQAFRKIMQSASKEDIAMDSLLEDPFTPLKMCVPKYYDLDVQLLMVTTKHRE